MNKNLAILIGSLVMILMSGCQSKEELWNQEADLYFDINDINEHMADVSEGIEADLEVSEYEGLEANIIETYKKELDKGLEMAEKLEPTEELEKQTKAYQDELKSLVADIKIVLEDPSKVDIVDEHEAYETAQEDLFNSFKYYDVE
jgi:predicted  nucleic acid-binding Zn-ribbon protein